MQIDWILAVGIVLTSILAVTGGLLLMSALPGRPDMHRSSIFA